MRIVHSTEYFRILANQERHLPKFEQIQRAKPRDSYLCEWVAVSHDFAKEHKLKEVADATRIKQELEQKRDWTAMLWSLEGE